MVNTILTLTQVVDVMVNYLYEALCRYDTHLCNTGYMKQSEVNKLLLLCAVQRLVDCDFRGLVSKDDYNLINDVMYKLYGSSCLIPYPDYYNNKTKRIMYTCSISELAHRVDRLEQEGTGGIPIELEDKEIIIPNTPIETVDDIDIS